MSTPASNKADNASPKPVVIYICLEQKAMFDDLYKGLIDQLAEKATIKRASKAQSAADYLASITPAIVIDTDGVIAGKKEDMNDLNTNLVSYTKNGGTVILGTLFSSFVRPPNFDRWMKETWNLPWKFGDYHRTDVFQNPACDLEGYKSEVFQKSYSQKAVFLKNVDKSAAVYHPSEESRTQSMVFPPTSVDVTQTPMTFMKIGTGRLGYIGDVNNENGSMAAIMILCNL